MDSENKIDLFSPQLIFAYVAAVIGDATFFLIIPHYLCGVIVVLFVWGKARGFLAKAVLIGGFLWPFNSLILTIVLTILLSNRIIAAAAEQLAIQAIAAVSGGAGEALEGVAVGAEAAEVGAGAVEAGSAAAEAGGTTLEMTETSPGNWEYQPEGAESGGVGETGTEGANQTEQGRPSDTSTERGSEVREGEGEGEGEAEKERRGRGGLEEETEEELEENARDRRRKESSDRDYKEDINAGNEPEVMEQTEEDLLGERGAAQQKIEPPKSEPSKTPPEESESTKRLRERFEKAQKVRDQLQKLKRPQDAGGQAEDDDEEDEGDDLAEEA